MKKISIYNHKGGVAKTTSVINIAYDMHKADKRVLVVDCDSQENSYSFFMKSTFYNISERIMMTDYDNISVIKWNEYANLKQAELDGYDYILFDLPPELNDGVKQIIKHTDKIYIPMMLRQFELTGLSKVTEVCDTKLGGIFITMYEKADQEILEQFKLVLNDRIMKSVIPFSRTVINSQRQLLPLEEYFVKRSVPRIFKNAWKVVDAYNELTNEIIGGVD